MRSDAHRKYPWSRMLRNQGILCIARVEPRIRIHPLSGRGMGVPDRWSRTRNGASKMRFLRLGPPDALPWAYIWGLGDCQRCITPQPEEWGTHNLYFPYRMLFASLCPSECRRPPRSGCGQHMTPHKRHYGRVGVTL
jgi:hypothetical protein